MSSAGWWELPPLPECFSGVDTHERDLSGLASPGLRLTWNLRRRPDLPPRVSPRNSSTPGPRFLPESCCLMTSVPGSVGTERNHLAQVASAAPCSNRASNPGNVTRNSELWGVFSVYGNVNDTVPSWPVAPRL